MKSKIIVLALSLVIVNVAFGIKLLPFPGWNSVKQKSPNIIIARCLKTASGPETDISGLIESDVQIVSVLKGRTNLGLARLTSTYWPRQGEQYLIFSIFHDEVYQASESYRIVPLGTYLPPDLFSDKTLDAQIQTLFRRRLDNLNRQMKEEQVEKLRLEEELNGRDGFSPHY